MTVGDHGADPPSGSEASTQPSEGSLWTRLPWIRASATRREHLLLGLVTVLVPLAVLTTGLFAARAGTGLPLGSVIGATATAVLLVAAVLARRGRVDAACRLAVAGAFGGCVAAVGLRTAVDPAVGYAFFAVPLAMSGLLLSARATAALTALAVVAVAIVPGDWFTRGLLALLAAMVGGLLTVGSRIHNLDRERIQRQNRHLARTRTWLDEAQRVSAVGTVSWKPGGRSWWSPEVYRTLGYEAGEIDPSLSAFRKHVHPEDREAFESTVQPGSAGPGPSGIECRLVRCDGETVDTIWQVDVLHDGDEPRMVGALQDVTDRKEDRALEKRLAVERARTRSLQEAVEIASHEFREPVRTVMTSIQRIQQEAGPDDPVTRDLHPVREATRRLHRVTDALVEFTEILARPLDAGPVDLGQALDEALATLREEEDLEVAVSAEGLGSVWADRRFLVQVLEELVGNAAQHGDPPVRVEARPRGDDWQITVSDAGPGIPERRREQVFEPFERLGREGWADQPGLGLTLTRRIVERHGGSVEARESPQGGAKIVVRLPKTDGGPSSEPVAGPADRGEATA